MQIVGQTWLSLVTLLCESWSDGQHELYLTVQWICLISWLFYECTSYFGIMNQYFSRFDLKVNVGHCDLYISLFGIMNQYDTTFAFKINVDTVTYISWSSDFAICLQDYLMYDQTFDLKINVGHCDLYFIVQWFCLISWRLFEILHHTLGL